jgi:glycosyltransferase involved in cell wall biosynthesis
MRIAFHAPLKPPDHPVPSGDRELARQLIAALRHAGHEVALASRLRTFDARGDAMRQSRLGALGERLAARIVARYRSQPRPDLWFTYHVHHKAPDVVGPRVRDALGIPYVVAEASLARKQRDGPWCVGYAQSLAAIRAADGIVFVNPVDVDAVVRERGDVEHVRLLPFIDVAAFSPLRGVARAPHARVRLVTVAMMREGAKLASYRVLAAALMRLVDLAWELTIVGDGPARLGVEQSFASLPQQRIHWLGACDRPGVAAVLREHDIFVWPAVDEAFGMALVEAQASGLPVVAGDAGGVASVVEHEAAGLLAPAGDDAAFARALRRLVVDAGLREAMAHRALHNARSHHGLAAAAAALDAFLARVRARKQGSAC